MYVTLILLTALMLFAMRGMITGSVRPFEAPESRATRGP